MAALIALTSHSTMAWVKTYSSRPSRKFKGSTDC